MMAKKIFIGLGLCALMALPAAHSNAAMCTNVEVLEAGANEVGKIVRLKNMSGAQCGNDWASETERNFYLDITSPNANALLATALSAQATGFRVRVITKNNGVLFVENSQLRAIFAITP